MAQEATDDVAPTVVTTPVSGTVDEIPRSVISVGVIDGDHLVTGFLLIIGFGGAGFVAIVFMSLNASQSSVPKDAVVSMINPILQTTYDGWQKLGVDVKETPQIQDDLLYAIANAPLEMLVEKLKELGYELTPVSGGPDEEVVVSTGDKSPGGQTDSS